MKRTTAFLTLIGLLALPSIASAQDKTTDPILDPGLNFKAGSELSGKVNLQPLAVRHRAEHDHIGTYNFWGGKVCLSGLSLSLKDGTATKQGDVTTLSYTSDKTTETFVKSGSVVEVLTGDDEINLLDTGRAGDNLTLYRASNDDGSLEIDKATPILHAGGTVAGSSLIGCRASGGTPAGILLTTTLGERIVKNGGTNEVVGITFALVDDEELLELMPIEDIFSISQGPNTTLGVRVDRIEMGVIDFGPSEVSMVSATDGTWEFELELIAPIAMEKGIVPIAMEKGLLDTTDQ